MLFLHVIQPMAANISKFLSIVLSVLNIFNGNMLKDAISCTCSELQDGARVMNDGVN